MNESSTPLTVKSAFDRLKVAGYPRSYIEKLLPDWWDNSLFKTSAGALQFALILKQRLGLDASFGIDGELQIHADQRSTRFKHRRGTKEAELAIAAGLGIAVAKLALFCTTQSYTPLPRDSEAIRSEILALNGKDHVDFEGTLKLCWSHGIPVVFLKDLPRTTKRMTGMALSIGGRPAIVLGFNHSQHSRQLFVLAHELGHIVLEHLGVDGIIVDEDISDVRDTLVEANDQRKDTEERQADALALAVIRGNHPDPIGVMGRLSSAAAIAARAALLSRELKIDADHLILSYGKMHNDWARASQAMGYSPSQPSAIEVIADHFRGGVDLGKLSIENQEYLLAVQGMGT